MNISNVWKHYILDLYDVNFDKILNFTQLNIKEKIVELLEKNWFTVLWNQFHFFGELDSFTGIVLLAESHFSIHTWPEIGYVSIDVFSCNFLSDNWPNIELFLDDLLKNFFDNKITAKQQIINR